MEPVSTGIGQGAAQVFGPSQAVNMYARASQQNMLLQQKEKLEVGKMMNDLLSESSKMRTEDIPNYVKTYNELRDVYASTNGLYTNPTKYPEQYKAAGKLLSDLRLQAAESIQQKQNLTKILDQYDANQDLFDDKTIEMAKLANSLPTQKIKSDLTGGTLFGREHVTYNPKALNWDAIGKGLRDFAEASGGVTDFFENSTTGPDVPKGYISSTHVRKYSPESIMGYTNRLLDNPTDRSFRKNMAIEYENIKARSPKELEKLSADASAFLGRDLGKIEDHEQYAKVKMLLAYKEERGEPKLINDQAWDQKNKLAAEGRAWGRQLTLEEIRQKRADDRAAKKNGPMQKKGLEDVSQEMAEAFDSKDVNTIIGVVQEPMLKFTSGSGTKPSVASPKNLFDQAGKKGHVGTEAKSKVAYSSYMNSVEKAFENPGNGVYAPRKNADGSLDKKYYTKLFNEGKALMFVPMEYEEEDPEDKSKMIKKERIGIIGDESNTKVRAAKIYNLMKKSGAPVGERKTNDPFVDVDLFE